MAASPAVILGDLSFAPPRQVAGWCLLPARRGHRATVEILLDGHCVAAMVAAQRRDGAGDGRHGFSLALPVAPAGPATRLIEARERDSGVLFGRVVLFADRLAQPLEDRLATLDMGALHHPLLMPAASGSGHAVAATRQAFGRLAAELRAHRGGAWRGERHRLAQCAPRLALCDAPSLSVILPASPSVDCTMEALVALQPLCDRMPTEILLADDGADPATLLLPQLVPRLRMMRVSAGLDGGALNMLAAEARGSALCFVATAPRSGHWSWPQFADAALPAGAVHLGSVTEPACARLVALWKPLARHSFLHGFALHLARDQLLEAGGFDTTLCGEAAYADIGLKCSLLGAAVMLWIAGGGG
jgi:hypothetical protein